jgi:hypothetical protein
MNKNFRSINIFVSHPFEPSNPTYNLEKFRTNIDLLITKAESLVRKEYQDFEIETIFEFSDTHEGLPSQIESSIRKSHFAIVDITENKPNIFYEYGLQYGLNIPAMLIRAKTSVLPLPADIKDRLVIQYDNFDQLRETCLDNVVNLFRKILNSDSLYNIYLNKIWFPADVTAINVVTSTESEKREQFASPESDNYMLLESLGDKDSLLEVMTFLNRTYRNVNIGMYAADTFPGNFLESNLVVIGGPGDEEGDGNNICRTMMEKLKLKVCYDEDCEKLLYKKQEYAATKKGNKTQKDFGYFARFPNPFNSKYSVVLINGIHTFGVLGASKAFSDHPSAQGNIKKLLTKFNLNDVKQAAFECFFEVDVTQDSIVCPNVDEDYMIPIA